MSLFPPISSDSIARCQRRGELQDQRTELAEQIRDLADRQSTWTNAERQRWDSLNDEYDAVTAQLEHYKLHPRLGRDGGKLSDFDGSGHLLDSALKGWALNQMGQPISGDDAEACHNFGVSPQSGTFVIKLSAHGPTWGLDLRNSLTRPGTGGVFQPSDVVGSLERAMLDFSGMLQASEIMRTTTGNELKWPTSDDTSNSGVQLGESQESIEDDIEFGAINFRSYKFSSKLIRVSHELIRDAEIDLPAALGQILGERLGRILNSKLTNGTGAATIVGILQAATVGKTAAAATAISFDDLIDLQGSVDPSYLSGSGVAWMMHQLVANALHKLKNGSGDYIWQPSMQAGQPATLLGFPVILNNDMPSTIASGNRTVVFGKLTQYKTRLVGEVRLRRLVERYGEFDEEGFVGFLSGDGNLLDPGNRAVKVLVQP